MYDNQLFTAFKAVLDAGLTARAIVAAVKQSYQPTTQGVNVGPTLYFTKIVPERRYGWPKVTDVWDAINELFIHTEVQFYETTLQVSAMLREEPDDVVGMTASDLGNQAASILQSEAGLADLAARGLTVLRITQVRNAKIVDGEGEFETIPSFDIVLLHEQVNVTETPAAVVKSLRIANV